MLAQKQVTRHIHERAYRNRPLSDEQKESNRQKSKIRARIEQIFGFMSQSMKGFYLRYIGRPPARRAAKSGGNCDLQPDYNLTRYEQMVRLKLRPRPPPEKRRSKPKTTENQLTTKDQTSGKCQRK